MRPTGREVRLKVTLEGQEDGERELAALWGLAVPLGFVPWSRYPLPGPGDDVFHYLGPWQSLYDSLCGEGRGDEAWPSLCCAAQVDVGRWEGTRTAERVVQAQLHRLGVPCGAVDGVVGERTLGALRALGVQGLRLEDVGEHLVKMVPPRLPKGARVVGQIIVPGGKVNALAHGAVSLTRTAQGYAMTVDGPGRGILAVDP